MEKPDPAKKRNMVRENIKNVLNKPSLPPKPQPADNKNYGKVPKYIEKYKEEAKEK